MPLPETANIVIIGGGVMGASTAYHLALRGEKNIVLLEKEAFFGQGATGRCAGGVRYQFATEVNIRLSKESLPMLERLEEETGQPADYRQCGYLMFLTREAGAEVFKRNIALQNSLGISSVWLTGDEVRRRVPIMALDDVLGGSYCHLDGLADPNSVVMAYMGAAARLGVQALTGVEVIGIDTQGAEVRKVLTDQGAIATGTVVNAAGPWAGLIGQMAGVNLPIEAVRRQILTTSPLPEIPSDFPFVIDFERSLYFHREGEGLLTGMSNPHEPSSFDQSVDPDWELIAMEAAIERLPLLEKAGMASHWAGLYENTPDKHPIYGKTPVDGFFVVGGFSGHGFMHGPISGKLMSEIILDGAASTVDVSGLDLARFVENRQILEYNVI